MFVTSVVQFWSEWGLRISVLGSLAAYTILSLLSGTRRRSASGRRSNLRWAVVLKLILWATYQAAELAATAALGSLSLSSSDVSADEQQLIAFWAPFLLLHLGGPDNMTAYTLEDNILSLRRGLEMILQLLGVMYAIWNYIYRSHSWVLLGASLIMFVTGGVRYVERAWALWRANLDNMQDSSKKKGPAGSGISRSTSTSTEGAVESAISRSLGRDLDDDEALLLAQDLFPIWCRALFDSAVDAGSTIQRSSEKLLFSLGRRSCRSMCKVVEMELSLMYEVLYTKASLAHTYRAGTCYLIIRFMSPPASTAAGWLFWLYSNKKGRQLRGSFVHITYLLLSAAFAMDMVWLLRALGSTWMYYFLEKNAQCRPWAWFHRKVSCAGKWLHRAVVYLDPLRLVFGIDPIGCRLWSGTIGQYNLLDECSTNRRRPWCLWLATKAGLEETRYLSELDEGAKKLLFERVLQILPRTTADNRDARKDSYTMAQITTCWGQEALRRSLFGRNSNQLSIFGREFEQDVLVWHIATCIFLSRGAARNPLNSLSPGHVAAIEAMSEYLMFLVAERRQMLPGLVLHSLLEETREALKELWDKEGKETTITSVAAGGNKKKLAALVQQKRNDDRGWFLQSEGRLLVLDAAQIASALKKYSIMSQQQVEMLELVFNIWVDKLLYAGVRCSRESHARQLSAGGELTTVLWIVTHHAGQFRIGQKKPGYEEEPDHKKEPGEKKKREERKKPPPCPMYLPYPYPYPPKPKPPPAEPGMPQEMPKPMPKPEVAEVEEMPMPEGELDPEDAKDCMMPIRFVTLY